MSRLLDVHNFVADKLRWQQQVVIDGGLSTSARLIGCLIAHDLNVERGAAWRAQDNMAIALGLSTRTVKRGIAELVALGHLAVRRSRGRGKTQNYSALLIDAAEDHDSIDKVIAARKQATKKVTAVSPDPEEKGSGVSPHGAEKVTPLTGKGDTRVPQSLDEPFNPPSPPSRANRVRSSWGDPVFKTSPFPDASVRAAIAGRLGEMGAVSWLDPAAWDGEGRVIVHCRAIAVEKLRSECGRELRGLGVTVICDKQRHGALSRQPRPVLAPLDQGEAA